MQTLHLIRHAMPLLDAARPSHEWELAPDALAGLPTLLHSLGPRPDIVITSEEAKAEATAQALAEALGVPCRRMLGLHEQLRYSVPFYTEQADLQREMRRLFDHPSEVVFGEESADTACKRFAAALRSVMAVNPQPCVAVVTHGTVRSLYVAHANNGLSAHTLWQQQKLLDVLSVSWPDGKLQ